MSFNIVTTTAAIRSAGRALPTSAIPTTTTALRPIVRRRKLSSSAKMDEKFKPARRVAGQRQDVWSIVNEAAAASPVQPIGESNIKSKRSENLTLSQ